VFDWLQKLFNYERASLFIIESVHYIQQSFKTSGPARKGYFGPAANSMKVTSV